MMTPSYHPRTHLSKQYEVIFLYEFGSQISTVFLKFEDDKLIWNKMNHVDNLSTIRLQQW